MAVGKSFLIVFSFVSLTACGTTSTYNETSHTSVSATASANSKYMPVHTTVGVMVNWMRWSYYKLPIEDQQAQERAIFFALDNSKNGEPTYWRNDRTGNMGTIQIMQSYPQGSGYCRIINSQIRSKGETRNFVETACRNGVEQGWRFVKT